MESESGSPDSQSAAAAGLSGYPPGVNEDWEHRQSANLTLQADIPVWLIQFQQDECCSIQQFIMYHSTFNAAMAAEPGALPGTRKEHVHWFTIPGVHIDGKPPVFSLSLAEVRGCTEQLQ